MKPSIIATSIFLLLVAIVHVIRLILQVKIIAGNYELPMWLSIPAAVVTAGLALWLMQDNKKQTL